MGDVVRVLGFVRVLNADAAAGEGAAGKHGCERFDHMSLSCFWMCARAVLSHTVYRTVTLRTVLSLGDCWSTDMRIQPATKLSAKHKYDTLQVRRQRTSRRSS